MIIVSNTGHELANAPVHPDRITLVGDIIVIELATADGEWQISLDRRDVGVLGGRLAYLTGSRP